MSFNRQKRDFTCPVAEQLVNEIVGVSQNKLLGTRKDMDDIISAVTKIYENRKELVAQA